MLPSRANWRRPSAQSCLTGSGASAACEVNANRDGALAHDKNVRVDLRWDSTAGLESLEELYRVGVLVTVAECLTEPDVHRSDKASRVLRLCSERRRGKSLVRELDKLRHVAQQWCLLGR